MIFLFDFFSPYFPLQSIWTYLFVPFLLLWINISSVTQCPSTYFLTWVTSALHSLVAFPKSVPSTILCGFGSLSQQWHDLRSYFISILHIWLINLRWVTVFFWGLLPVFVAPYETLHPLGVLPFIGIPYFFNFLLMVLQLALLSRCSYKPFKTSLSSILTILKKIVTFHKSPYHSVEFFPHRCQGFA